MGNSQLPSPSTGSDLRSPGWGGIKAARIRWKAAWAAFHLRGRWLPKDRQAFPPRAGIFPPMEETREDAARLRAELLAGDLPAAQFLRLWEAAPEVRFFAKSARGRFLSVSRNLLELNGLRREEEILGLSDFDLYPNSIAEKFTQDDGTVVQEAKPLPDILEIFLDEKGSPAWYLTHKLPIRTREGSVLGVMGTSRKFTGAAAEANPCPALHRAVRFMQQRFTDNLSVPELAATVHLSVRQFQRAFLRHFRTTPSKYLIRMRVLAACDALASGRKPVSEIAYAMGFGDESHFIRTFKGHMGVTPLQYRLRRR